MIDELVAAGATITAFDPEAMPNVERLIGDKINYGTDEYSILEGADALLICTEWGIFRNPDFSKIKSLLKDAVVFDGRNLFDMDEMSEKGFFYSSIGRKLINK
jgi:UDPglucose 6-dehydrogenase